MTRHSAAVVACAIGGALLMSSGARASDVTFAGKTLTTFVASATGGNYDAVARLVDRHMGDFLPGTPSIIVSNMPGAGGLRAANHLFNVAPKDGTALGVVSSSLALEEALGTQGVQYRAADFTWIGRVSTVLEPLVTVDPAPAKQFSDTNRGQRL